MKLKVGVSLLELCIIQVLGVASYNLSMHPVHVRISKDPSAVYLSCTADVALTGCQFRWWSYDDTTGPVLDLSQGSQSHINPNHLSDGFTGYNYAGKGLDHGECNVILHLQGWKCWMVACRVHSVDHGWTYAWMDVYAEIWSALQHTVTPREAVVLPGGEATFTLKSQRSLSHCGFHLPPHVEHQVAFNEGEWSAHSTGRHRYLGAGPEVGECGLVLANVNEKDNGPARTYARSKPPKTDDQRYNPIIVARRPTAPVLHVVQNGADVTATCEVQESRPIAQISWYLGDTILRHDSLDDSQASPQDEWRWPWMEGAIKQRVQLKLKAPYYQKVLKCSVSHVTLQRPLEASTIISYSESASENVTLPETNSKPIRFEFLDLLCHDYSVRASQIVSSPKDELYLLRIREAEFLATASEIAVQAARSSLKAQEAMAQAAELEVQVARSHARAEDAWAKIAEEELLFAKGHRNRNQSQCPPT